MSAIEWWVGFDWASKKHRACVLDGRGQVIGERDVDHAGEGLAAFCDWLIKQTASVPERIAVAIETPHGPVVETLLERGFAVYALNPKQLDRFRDRFTVAGAKDDSRDARVLADSLRTDTAAFRRLAVEDPLIIQLREWTRLREDLIQECNRLTNRLREQLWRYYPQALELTDDLGAAWFLALWQQAPTPAHAARLRPSSVQKLLQAHRIRRLDAAEVLGILRRKPLAVAPGAAEAARAHIRTLLPRLQLVNQQLHSAERQLDELCGQIQQQTESEPGQLLEQRDVAILRSCPGNGRIVLATLLAEAAEPLRCRDYHALRSLCGVAPVTRRSGKSCRVLRRHACNERLRNAAYHWARTAIQYDPVSRRRYRELRLHGHSHGRALRTIADRLLYVLCTLLQRQTLFDRHHVSPCPQAA